MYDININIFFLIIAQWIDKLMKIIYFLNYIKTIQNIKLTLNNQKSIRTNI